MGRPPGTSLSGGAREPTPCRVTATMLRIFVVYKPFVFFMSIGAIVFGAGILIGIRYLVLLFGGAGEGHTQSLILASILLGIGFQTMITAFLADLLAVNRTLLEEIEYRTVKSADSEAPKAPKAPTAGRGR